MPIQPGVMHAPPSVAYRQNIDLHAEPVKPGRRSDTAASAPTVVRSARHAAQSNAPEAARPALVRQAREKSLLPTPKTTLSRSDMVEAGVDRSSELLKSARQVGVDTANRTFMRKCAQCIGHGVVLGLTVALATMSFGAAAPLVAVAATVFAVSTGDAACAYKNRQAAKDMAEGKPAQMLIGGSSIVSNLSMTACRALADQFSKGNDMSGVPDEVRYKTADTVAKVFSGIAEIGLVAASFVIGTGFAEAGKLAAEGALLISDASMATMNGALIASKISGTLVALTASVDSGVVGGGFAVGNLDKHLFAAQKDGSDPVQAAVPRKGEALTNLNFSLHYLLAAQKADPVYFEEIASNDQKALLKELQTSTRMWEESEADTPAQLAMTKELSKIAGDPGNAWSKMISFGAGVAGVVRGVATA